MMNHELWFWLNYERETYQCWNWDQFRKTRALNTLAKSRDSGNVKNADLFPFRFDIDTGDGPFGTVEDDRVSRPEHVSHLLSTNNTR